MELQKYEVMSGDVFHLTNQQRAYNILWYQNPWCQYPWEKKPSFNMFAYLSVYKIVDTK